MSLTDYLSVLARRWPIWSSFLLLGILGALLITSQSPTRYTATATTVTVVNFSDRDPATIFQGSQFAIQRVKSYQQLVTGDRVLAPVIEELSLDMPVSELRSKISTSNPPETALIGISVTDADPDQAALLANEVARSLGALVESLENPDNGQGSASVRIELPNPAEPPGSPSSPNGGLNLLLGSVFGLGVGLAATVLRHQTDRRVRRLPELQRVPDAHPLGVVPQARRFVRTPMLATGPRAEPYRQIRASLRLAAGGGLRDLVVTEVREGDGASTTALNLAAAFAGGGATVCLVETDLRSPSIARRLGLPAGPGALEVMRRDVELAEAVVPTEQPRLSLLSASSEPVEDSAAVLERPEFSDLVRRLRSEYDVVVYDAPPLVHADPLLVGSRVDGALLVVGAGRKVAEVQAAIDLLRTSRCRLLGSVLFAARAHHHRGYAAIPPVTAAGSDRPGLARSFSDGSLLPE